MDEPWHGTDSGYTNHKCRCDACKLAHRRKAAEYRERNAEKVNERKREWYERNAEKVNEQNKAWRERNPEKVKAADKVKRQRTREQRRERDRRRYRENRQQFIDKGREWKRAHPEAEKARRIRVRQRDIEAFRKRNRDATRRARQRNPESVRERFRRWAASPDGLAYFRAARQERKGALTDGWTRPWVGIIALDPCCYCGGPGGHIDHISAGRPRDSRWTNLTSACQSCNSSKHVSSLLQFLVRRRE